MNRSELDELRPFHIPDAHEPHLELPGISPKSAREFFELQPPVEWFADPNGFHGIGHAARVVILAGIIDGSPSVANGSEPADWEVIKYASLLHDISATDAVDNPNHGLLGADKITHLKLPVSQSKREKIQQIVQWHSRNISEIPAEIRETPEFKTLQAADASDRVRLKGWDNEAVLLPDFTRKELRPYGMFKQVAQTLFDVSKKYCTDNPHNTYAEIGNAALSLGYLTDDRS